MRTLFAKFLLWFWLGLAALLAIEIVLETHSLEQGIALRPGRADDPYAPHAELARVTLAERGRGGLDSLVARIGAGGVLEAYAVDSVSAGPAPGTAAAAGLSALRSGHSEVVESPSGFFLAYVIGRDAGRGVALVLRPRHGGEREDAEGGWPPFLPRDLGVRAIATLILGGVGCYFLARYVTAPVSRLRGATRRIADGDLTARTGAAASRRRDELADLGRDFDAMADRLEASLTAQRRLLSDISHELRSPLARMNVAIELMRQRAAVDETMMARLETETARLNRLIGDLLALSRAESGEPAPGAEPVDLVALVEAVVEDARFEAGPQDKQVRFESRVPVVAYGAPELLRSAIENVVRNAVRHTAPGTAVEVFVGPTGTPAGAAAIVEVRDHGPGVPPEELQRIFEPFHRVPGAPPTGGAGLGLAIARRVVTRYGGAIFARAAEGGGLRITLMLAAKD